MGHRLGMQGALGQNGGGLGRTLSPGGRKAKTTWDLRTVSPSFPPDETGGHRGRRSLKLTHSGLSACASLFVWLEFWAFLALFRGLPERETSSRVGAERAPCSPGGKGQGHRTRRGQSQRGRLAPSPVRCPPAPVHLVFLTPTTTARAPGWPP